MSTLTYQTTPLDPARETIRLLTVLPKPEDSTDDVEIHCTLRVATLSAATNFTAVSYTWGDQALTKNIIINGNATSVTENLESALRHFRQTHPGAEFWIDAISIDQNNTQEKSQQVSHMHEIYSLAKQTLVWLGPAGHGSDMAMRTFKDIGRDAAETGVMHVAVIRAGRARGIRFPGADILEYEQALPKVYELIKSIGWNFPFKAARHLFARPYFLRLWVAQEWTLAKSLVIQCGLSMATGEEFMATTMFTSMLWFSLTQNHAPEDQITPVDATSDYEPECDGNGNAESRLQHVLRNAPLAMSSILLAIRSGHAFWIRGPRLPSSPAYQLMDLLERANVLAPGGNVALFRIDPIQPSGYLALDSLTRILNLPFRGLLLTSTGWHRLEVTIAKDRVYGLLGMIGGVQDTGIQIDYSATDEHVFQAVAEKLLRDGAIPLLHYARIHVDSDLPSWAPDWRERLVPPSMQWGQFVPAGTLPYHLMTFRNSKTLWMPCVVVDTIKHGGFHWEARSFSLSGAWEDAQRMLIDVRDLLAEHHEPPLPCISAERWREGFWRIPIADQYINDSFLRCRATPAALEGYELVMLGRDGSEDARDTESGRLTHLDRYKMGMTHIASRAVVQTKLGLVGLAPPSVQEGDVVVIVPYVGSPLVLRPHHEEETIFYQIVGEVYVHGIMDGEFIDGNHVVQWVDVR